MRASDFKQMHVMSSGEYSDYCVNAIFEDEADAQAWAAAMNARSKYAQAQVELLPVIPKGAKPTVETRWTVQIELYPDGRVENRGPYHEDKWGFEYEQEWWERLSRPSVSRFKCTGYDLVTIHGPTEEHVLKVASERMARWKAEGHILEAARKEIEEEKRT
jgi:hypothetical protein